MRSVISPVQKLSLNLPELWQYRELFYFFTWRDIKVKYKQTVLGILAWAVLQPLFLMIVFTFFFGRSLRIDTQGVPYPLFVFSGLTLWNLFSNGISNAGNSMVSNANIIKKIYFPRLIIPISSILSSLIDFCFAFIVLIAMAIWYSSGLNVYALICWPLGVVLASIATFGPGCLLAALNIKYRDFRYVIPFLVQALLFLTPVIYPITVVNKGWAQTLLALNPMYAAIEIFRFPFTGTFNDMMFFWTSIGSGLALLLAGLFYFKKTEMYFADLA